MTYEHRRVTEYEYMKFIRASQITLLMLPLIE